MSKTYVVVVEKENATEDTSSILQTLDEMIFESKDELEERIDSTLGNVVPKLYEAGEYTQELHHGELKHKPHLISICLCESDVYILYSCDVWGSKSSMRTIVASVNKKTITKFLKKALVDNYTSDITDPDSEWTPEKINDVTFEMLEQQQIDYFYLEVI